MHGPTGFSGVHTLRKSGHSLGSMRARRTSPQRQPLGLMVGSISGWKRFSASNCANPSRIRYPLPGISPRPRQVAVQVSKTSSIAASATGLPCGMTPRA